MSVVCNACGVARCLLVVAGCSLCVVERCVMFVCCSLVCACLLCVARVCLLCDDVLVVVRCVLYVVRCVWCMLCVVRCGLLVGCWLLVVVVLFVDCCLSTAVRYFVCCFGTCCYSLSVV